MPHARPRNSGSLRLHGLDLLPLQGCRHHNTDFLGNRNPKGAIWCNHVMFRVSGFGFRDFFLFRAEAWHHPEGDDEGTQLQGVWTAVYEACVGYTPTEENVSLKSKVKSSHRLICPMSSRQRQPEQGGGVKKLSHGLCHSSSVKKVHGMDSDVFATCQLATGWVTQLCG